MVVQTSGFRIVTSSMHVTALSTWYKDNCTVEIVSCTPGFGMAATHKALTLSLDLHAFHHFTHAAAVDGSCMEHTDAHTPYRRQLAYGVYDL